MNNIYAIFHLNLAYSSISKEQRIDVIKRCYWPLLDLIEHNNIPLGIELSGWTLQQIHRLSPDWIGKFRQLLANRSCELIGSGYCQTIGPLLPYEVNHWNQSLGCEDYQEILGIKPRIALVNEMAYSSGLVSIYDEAGYEGIIIDHDNVCHALGMEKKGSQLPFYADGEDGSILPVLWSDSILFQKLQRYAHKDISKQDYLDYLNFRKSDISGALCLYCNDAEVINYRPGRYSTELALNGKSEWKRVARLFNYLFYATDVHWCLPSAVLQLQLNNKDTTSFVFSSVRQPIPVKKQLKYNVSRWAITGRNDLWINTMCYRIYNKLISEKYENTENYKRNLLECWSSDLRTHITSERWEQAKLQVRSILSELNLSDKYSSVENNVKRCINTNSQIKNAYIIENNNDGIILQVKTNLIDVQFNQRRGMSIHSLAFAKYNYQPLLGTLPQGYFDSIELGADFYSCATVVDLIKQHHRVTDLQKGKHIIYQINNELCIETEIQTKIGKITKQYFLHDEKEQLRVKFSFSNWKRPYGTLRVGTLTLIPGAYDEELFIRCKMGGATDQTFIVNEECAHQEAVSTIVSCTTGIGATDGKLTIGDTKKRLCIMWDQSQCAAFPMLYHTIHYPQALTRIYFSLSELDETFVEGGTLPAFEFVLSLE